MSSSPCRANTPPPTEPSSSKLFTRPAELSAGFERDVVSMRGALYRHAYRLSQNHQDVEDLVQETMMKAYAAFHTFRVDTNLIAWVFRLLTNTYSTATARSGAGRAVLHRRRHRSTPGGGLRPLHAGRAAFGRGSGACCRTPTSRRRWRHFLRSFARRCTSPTSKGSVMRRSRPSRTPRKER